MSIQYILVQKGFSGSKGEPKKYYAQAKSKGEMNWRQLAERISKISTISTIDTMALLDALIKVIPQELAEGKIVKLGEFGSFYTALNSTGEEKKESFKENNIKKTVVKYRPGKMINNILRNCEYERIKD